MGGAVHLLPVVVGHIYAAAHQGREKTADESALIWANRYAIVNALPAGKEYKEPLFAWMDRTRRVCTDIPDTADDDLCEVWANGKRDWLDLLDMEIVREATEKEARSYLGDSRTMKADAKRAIPPAPPNDTTQIIMRKAEVCKRCNAINSFRKVEGTRKGPLFGLSYARCANCGHKGQIRVV
jgi:hypothetical protein